MYFPKINHCDLIWIPISCYNSTTTLPGVHVMDVIFLRPSILIYIYNQTPDLSFSQDYSYDLRLMSRRNKVLSEPSESVNVSTIGKWLCIDNHEHSFHIESGFRHR